ncbi:GAF domain-containing protein [Halomonas denitrificans]|nr:GAF domain-containing protein [Halomonas denitrificans]
MNLDQPLTPVESWDELLDRARALLHGETHSLANAANLSALIFHSLADLNWAGFYFAEGEELVVGPFQGLPACVRIPFGRGVCGTAAVERTTQRVADVHAFDGHIACDVNSRSEIVVPLIRNGELLGVLDVDSPTPDRFDAADQAGFEALAAIYVASLQSSSKDG